MIPGVEKPDEIENCNFEARSHNTTAHGHAFNAIQVVYAIHGHNQFRSGYILEDILGQGLEPFPGLPKRVYIFTEGETGVTLADVTMLLTVKLQSSTWQSLTRV